MAKHTLTPTITVSYNSVISAPCSRGGDGQCDGYIYDETSEHDGEVCACSCHSGWDDCPTGTVAEVAEWHAKEWKMFG